MKKSHKKRHHRRRRSRFFMNPISASAIMSKPREMFSVGFAVEAVAATVGFILPNMAMGYVPAMLRDTKVKFYVSKVAVVAGLSVVAGFHSKRTSRIVLLGGAVSLLLDAYTEFQNRHAAPAAPTGTQAYYGGMDTYYGPGIADGSEVGEGLQEEVDGALVNEGVTF